MKAFAQRFFFAAVWLSGAISLGACGSQGEGEHCDQLNGSNDCGSGLQCSMASICCIPGTAACNAPPAGAAGSGGSGGSGGGDAATSDAAIETSTSDAAIETSTSDAAPEAAANDAGADSSSANDGAAE